MTPRCHSAAILTLLLPVLLASASHASDGPAPRVYANAKDGKILRVDFADNSTELINTDGAPGIQLEGLVLRDDGLDGVQLIVANRQEGVKIYLDPLENVTGHVIAFDEQIVDPDALALGTGGILFVTSDSGKVYRIRRKSGDGARPGGYDPTPFQIDGSVPSKQLEGAKVVGFDAGALDPGDLLVLGRDKPVVFRYANAATCAPGPNPCTRQEFIPQSRFPSGAHPSGFDFLGRTLLVALEGGTILRFNSSGNRVLPDFASGLGSGKLEVAVGDDGFVYVTRNDVSGEAVRRFSVASNGTGIPAGSVSAGVGKPTGVDSTTANVVSFTQNQTSVAATFVNELNCGGAGWTADGKLTGNVRVFEDIREAEACAMSHVSCSNSKKALHRSLNLQEIDAGLPNVVIPRYIRALRKLGPGQSASDVPKTGPPVLIVVIQDTNRACTDPPETHGEEAVVMGYDPPTNVPLDRSAEARWVWGPSTGEPPLLESPNAIEITSGPGSTRGHSTDTSVFAHGRNTRVLDSLSRTVAQSVNCTATDGSEAAEGVVDCELRTLKQALEATGAAGHFSCISSSTRATLKNKANSAISSFDDQSYFSAKTKLIDFETFIKNNPSRFSACTQREGPELRARALSLVYMLGKLP